MDYSNLEVHNHESFQLIYHQYIANMKYISSLKMTLLVNLKYDTHTQSFFIQKAAYYSKSNNLPIENPADFLEEFATKTLS